MKRLFLSAIVAASVFAVNAQDSTTVATEDVVEESNKLSISGSIDTYYQAVVSDLDSKTGAPTSFANDANSFSLGMANLVLAKDGKKSGFVADLAFGPRAIEAGAKGNDIAGNNPSLGVNAIYGYFNLTDNVVASLGKFGTFVGYEVISPVGNFNYTTSYMFSNGPFTNTGLKFDITLSDKLSVMAGVFNNTDAPYDADNKKHYGLQLGYTPSEETSIYFNFLNGEDTPGATHNIYDITAGTQASDELYVGFNTTFNDNGGAAWFGAALYTNYAISEVTGIGFRGEFISNSDGVIGVTSESIIDLTVSANIAIGDLNLIPEFRIDLAKDGFTKADGSVTGSLATIGLAAVYAF